MNLCMWARLCTCSPKKQLSNEILLQCKYCTSLVRPLVLVTRQIKTLPLGMESLNASLAVEYLSTIYPFYIRTSHQTLLAFFVTHHLSI